MRISRWFAAIALVLSAAAARSEAGSFTQIVAFGDSLTDTGNVYAAQASQGVNFPTSPPYYDGRFSNGPLWIETLAAGLGVPDPTPSLLGGTDYAWGGAETGLGISIQGTPNIGTQIGTYLATDPTITSSQLFVVWGGANDFLHFPTLPLPDPAEVVSNLTTEITELADAGAKSFLVPNLPLLGDTPYVSQILAPSYPGIVATMDSLTLQFNADLAVALAGLQSSLGITIYQLDVNGVLQEVLDDQGKYGITNTTDQAKSGGEGDPGTVVPDPNSYIFWDQVHPTATLHTLIGQAALEAVTVPEPGSSTLLALGLLGLLATARRRRRPRASEGGDVMA